MYVKKVISHIDDEVTEINSQTKSNWLIYELAVFKDIFNSSNLARCYELLDYSYEVMKVFEQARKKWRNLLSSRSEIADLYNSTLLGSSLIEEPLPLIKYHNQSFFRARKVSLNIDNLRKTLVDPDKKSV